MTASTTTSAPTPRLAAAWHRRLLAVDAAGCLVIGLALLLGATSLRADLGAATSAPVRAVGATFVAAAIANALAAGRPWGPALAAAVAADVVGVVVLGTAAANLDGASSWGRAAMVCGIAVSALFGGLKSIGRSRPVPR